MNTFAKDLYGVGLLQREKAMTASRDRAQAAFGFCLFAFGVLAFFDLGPVLSVLLYTLLTITTGLNLIVWRLYARATRILREEVRTSVRSRRRPVSFPEGER